MPEKTNASSHPTFPTVLSLASMGLLFAAFSLPASGQSVAAPRAAESTRYLITFRPNVNDARQQAESMANGAGRRPDFVYEHVMKGFAVTLPDAGARSFLDAMRRNPMVSAVEPDMEVRRQQAVQSPATWGLDRIDQRNLPLNSSYSYPFTGQGVQVHILDTGVLASHTEFSGRMLPGYTAINDGRGTTDCEGHGTHVAATTAGSLYGVAKGASIVPVRVLGCDGSGSMAGVIAGLDWVAANAVRPAVVNMSLGGGAYLTLDNAVARVVASGISVVVAAGNSNADACNSSPARAPSALTVGASSNSDARASFSNWGSCLDLFAPGVSITSAAISNDSATATMSGTSMASPHVAGNVALLLQANTALTPAQVTELVKARATPAKVTGAGTGSPNLMLYTGTDNWIPTGGTTPTRWVHTASLTGSKVLSKTSWRATATVLVKDDLGAVVQGASVSGKFNRSTSTYSCTTGSAGTCSVSITLKNTITSAAFGVSGITGTGMTYNAGNNVATSVTITR